MMRRCFLHHCNSPITVTCQKQAQQQQQLQRKMILAATRSIKSSCRIRSIHSSSSSSPVVSNLSTRTCSVWVPNKSTAKNSQTTTTKTTTNTRHFSTSLSPHHANTTTNYPILTNHHQKDHVAKNFVTSSINPVQLQYRYKTYQATSILYKNEDDSSSNKADDNDDDNDDNEVPEYQNPKHHNNPENEKILLDEDFNPDENPDIVPLPPLDDGSGKVVADPHLHELAEEILQLSMYEMKELVDRVADHFGFEENDDDDFGGDVGGDGGAGGGDGGAEEAQEEKTAFDLKLTGFDAKAKIKVIKEIRAITGLGLKEAKEMVEGAPKVVKKEIKKEEAEELKEKLEAVGATVEIE